MPATQGATFGQPSPHLNPPGLDVSTWGGTLADPSANLATVLHVPFLSICPLSCLPNEEEDEERP